MRKLRSDCGYKAKKMVKEQTQKLFTDASRTEKYKIRKMRGCTGFPQKVTASDAMTQRL